MSITRLATLTFDAGEKNIEGPAIKVNNTSGYIYVGHRPTTTATQVALTRIVHSTFTRDILVKQAAGGATNPNANNLTIDEVNNRLFLGSANFMFTVDISSGISVIASRASTTSSLLVKSVAVDSTNSKLYSAEGAGAARIVLEMNYGLTTLRSVVPSVVSSCDNIVLDTVRGFAYASNNAANGNIFQVRLSDFTITNTYTPTTGIIYNSEIDLVNGFAYFLYPSTKLVRMDLNTNAFTILSSGFASFIDAITISPLAGYAYIVSGSSPAKIFEIELSTFTITDSLTLNTGENAAVGVSIHKQSGIFYVALNGDPIRIVQFQGVANPPTTVPLSGANLRRKAPYFDVQSMMNRLYN